MLCETKKSNLPAGLQENRLHADLRRHLSLPVRPVESAQQESEVDVPQYVARPAVDADQPDRDDRHADDCLDRSVRR